MKISESPSIDRWGQVIVLLGLLFLAAWVAPSIPGARASSNDMANWQEPLFLGAASLCLAIGTHWIYRRPSAIFKWQAILLWFLFGAIAMMSVANAIGSFRYERDAMRRYQGMQVERSHGESTRCAEQATGGDVQ